MKFSIFTFLFAFATLVTSALAYDVQIAGVKDTTLLSQLKTHSQALSLSQKEPSSTAAFRRRGEADIENFLKVLHSLSYYNAHVDLEIVNSTLLFKIDTGPQYPIQEFKVVPSSDSVDLYPLHVISLENIGITLGNPAVSSDILLAEEKLLYILHSQSFPLATIQKREVVVDQHSQTVNVIIYVDSGPNSTFGPTTITGLSSVREEFLRKKIGWSEGSHFNYEDIAQTQEALEQSGLFSSTAITYEDTSCSDGSLPMNIQVTEAKHRTIAAGLSFMTQRGPGLNAEWDHRNFRGLGERLRFRTNIWKDTQEARVSYVLPDFKMSGQDLIWAAEIEHEALEGYTDTSFSLSSIIDRKYNDRLRFSYGGMYKAILTSHSDNNGNFHLLKSPMQVRWSSANDLLDPTEGASVNLKIAPTVQLIKPQFAYCPVTFTSTFYKPLTKEHRIVLAAKASVGSIIGSSHQAIPPSERFYAGSENTLRGYRYMTVSPLDNDYKPIGGKSFMLGSLEARFRLTENFGLVGFYDIGNVYESGVPKFSHKQLQSVGAGVRYHTPVGPIRLDFAVPLNKRKHIDADYQIYMSIGQSF